MTSIAVAENKISSLRKYLAILESYRGCALSDLDGDHTLRGAVERYLYLVSQAAIDLAEVIISVSKFRKPATMAEGFTILSENGVIGAELKGKMVKLVGFRNILAHEYERLDYEILLDALKNRLGDIREFIRAAERFLNL